MATQLPCNVQSVLQQGGCDMATLAGLQPPLPPDQLYGHVQSDLQQGGHDMVTLAAPHTPVPLVSPSLQCALHHVHIQLGQPHDQAKSDIKQTYVCQVPKTLLPTRMHPSGCLVNTSKSIVLLHPP